MLADTCTLQSFCIAACEDKGREQAHCIPGGGSINLRVAGNSMSWCGCAR